MTKKEFDIAFFKELADFLKENELKEIEYSEGDRKIRLEKEHASIAAPAFSPSSAALASFSPSSSSQITSEPQQDSASDSALSDEPVYDPKAIVKSPMVGVAYMAPSPDAAPFVKEGDRVSAGQTLLIVEAMKVMNPIKAPHDGVVKKIIAENAHPVEFDEVLMVVEP